MIKLLKVTTVEKFRKLMVLSGDLIISHGRAAGLLQYRVLVLNLGFSEAQKLHNSEISETT